MFTELSPWFQSTSLDWSLMYEYGKIQIVETGETIYSVHQQANHVYIIKEGRVRLFHTSSDGKEKALIIMCDNTIIGDSKLNELHFESAVTASKTTLIKFNRELFMAILKNNKELLAQWIKLLDHKAQTLALSNLLVSCYDSETRIRYALFHLANQFGTPTEEGGKRIFMQFTQQELADLVGTSRVTVANMVNTFIQQDLIEKDGRFYIIPSVKRILPNN